MNFYLDVIRRSKMFDTVDRISTLSMLEPITRKAVQEIMLEAAEEGNPLICFETYRSEARQAELFKRGATQLDTVGCHHYGIAADLVKNINGEPSWKGDFSFLGLLAKKHGLIWGGNWGEPFKPHGFVDACHVQRVAVADQPELFAGTFYPADDYKAFA